MTRTILATLLALSTALHAADAPAPATNAAPSRFAAIELKVDSSDVAPIQAEKAVAYLRKRAAELAPEMLGINDDNLGDWLQFNWGMNQHGLSELNIRVSLFNPAAKPAAGAFADALVDALREYHKAIFDEKVAQTIPAGEQRLAKLKAANDDAQRRIKDVREQVRELSGRSDSSGINEAVSKLEDELTRLQLEVLAKTARREALEKQIAEQAELVEKRIGNDAIALELQKVVEAREAQVQRMKELMAQKAASAAEVTEAVGRIAEARAKVLERKRDAAAEAGGDAMAMLNRELLTLSVDLTELNARLEFVQKRVPRLRQAQDLVDEYNRARRTANEAQNQIDDLSRALEGWREKLSKPPEVAVTSREVRELARDSQNREIPTEQLTH